MTAARDGLKGRWPGRRARAQAVDRGIRQNILAGLGKTGCRISLSFSLSPQRGSGSGNFGGGAALPRAQGRGLGDLAGGVWSSNLLRGGGDMKRKIEIACASDSRVPGLGPVAGSHVRGTRVVELGSCTGGLVRLRRSLVRVHASKQAGQRTANVGMRQDGYQSGGKGA